MIENLKITLIFDDLLSNLKLKMKKLLLIFTMLLAHVGSNAQGVWVSQATAFSTPSTGIRNISVVDTNVVWISSYDGSGGGFSRQDYSRTIDGGNTWEAGLIPTNFVWNWAHISGSSATKAWAVFYNTSVTPQGQGQIWHTSDGGATWTQQGLGINPVYSSVGSFPNVIHFFNDLDGVVIGDPANGEYEIYTTSDGGTTWNQVPGANIPDPDDALEAGWTTHIQTVGDNVWFDTNHGRVYNSFDKGLTWTVASTNLFIPLPGTIDICFYGPLKGIARYYDDALINSDIVETFDGGITWSTLFNPVGDFFGADVQGVPGTNSMLVSTGVSTSSGFTGSSYSLDGGHNWTTIDAGVQRNALAIADSLTMWTGGFNTSETADGIFKFLVINGVSCSDPAVSPGVATVNATYLCENDTLEFTSTGVYSPVAGTYSGFSWVLSTADISGSTSPLSEPSFRASYRTTFPAPNIDTRSFINNGSIINGTNLPYGTYYWTPVVFGNAVALNPPVNFLQDLTLDPLCTTLGNSVAVNVLDPAIVPCDPDAVSQINTIQLSVKTFIRDRNILDVMINSTVNGKVSIQITDLTGRLVKNQNSNVTTGSNHEFINIENLASGTYILKAEINGNQVTNKVVKY